MFCKCLYLQDIYAQKFIKFLLYKCFVEVGWFLVVSRQLCYLNFGQELL